MRRKLGLAILGTLIALVGLTVFDTGTMLSPSPLQAQACGPYKGNVCNIDCVRQCTGGGCCSWNLFYYSAPAEPD